MARGSGIRAAIRVAAMSGRSARRGIGSVLSAGELIASLNHAEAEWKLNELSSLYLILHDFSGFPQ
jgi:hypothetical protein